MVNNDSLQLIPPGNKDYYSALCANPCFNLLLCLSYKKAEHLKQTAVDPQKTLHPSEQSFGVILLSYPTPHVPNIAQVSPYPKYATVKNNLRVRYEKTFSFIFIQVSQQAVTSFFSLNSSTPKQFLTHRPPPPSK